MQAIVLADGDVEPRSALDAAWPGWLLDDRIVIAADGGARHAATLGLTIDRWVGDGDSLDDVTRAELVASDIPMTVVPAAKDESDTELAVLSAIEARPSSVVIVGALGGPRVDHALANLGLLTLLLAVGLPSTIVTARARIRMVAGSAVLDGGVGDLVTLLPVGGDVVGVTTDGLAYPLADETLLDGRARGLSNIRVSPEAQIRFRAGRLLVIETPATLAR